MDAIWIHFLLFISFTCYTVGSSRNVYQLNDGNEIPVVALGTSLGHLADGTRILPVNHSVARAVQWALESGYRNIDTATLYKVEDEVGLGVASYLKDNNATRSSVFITTKLWNDAHDREAVPVALRQSLKELNLEYVDLYLIHFPFAYEKDGYTISETDYLTTWKGMEDVKDLNLTRSIGVSNFNLTQMQRLWDISRIKPAVLQIEKDGYTISETDYLTTWKGMEDVKDLNLTRSIGVSNFNLTQMQRLWDISRIKPAVLQIEINPTIIQEELVKWCQDHGVVVMAYSPFGGILGRKSDAPPPRADDPTLVSLSRKYNKTVPQVLLRYLLDRKIIPIPRSMSKGHIEKNIDIFDFTLTPEEVDRLSQFNSNYQLRTRTYIKWYRHPYFPYLKLNLTDAEIQAVIDSIKGD